MSVRLWHFTWPENIASIRENGFRARNRDGDRNCVFFATVGDNRFEIGPRELLEVILKVDDADIARYAQPTVLGNGKPSVIYMIPPEFVNAHTIEIRAATRTEDGQWDTMTDSE